MKATNKQEFFELLESELRRIGIDDDQEISDIFADFEEHFTDGAMQGIPEDITAERLGDIKEIARSYLNLESSRINSIMARDIERRKISLTKPGRGVPADLSLIGSGSAKDIANSDNIREYTPQHFSGEIYPQSPNSHQTFGNSVNSGNVGNGVENSVQAKSGGLAGENSSTTGAGTTGTGTTGAASGTNTGVNTAGSTENKSVADAFSDAGRAALDAAKITGHAVADAFKNSGVKQAVVDAGKTAADAVKAAGDAVRNAAAKPREKRSKKQNDQAYSTAFRPSDTFRQNMDTTGRDPSDNSRKAEIPPQYSKSKTAKKGGGYKMISISDLTPNINSGKLILAILLDCFLWSWLISAIIGGLMAMLYFGVIDMIANGFKTIFGFAHREYFFISRLFLGLGQFWLGIVIVHITGFFVQLFSNLVKFIINLHIKAIYDI